MVSEFRRIGPLPATEADQAAAVEESAGRAAMATLAAVPRQASSTPAEPAPRPGSPLEAAAGGGATAGADATAGEELDEAPADPATDLIGEVNAFLGEHRWSPDVVAVQVLVTPIADARTSGMALYQAFVTHPAVRP